MRTSLVERILAALEHSESNEPNPHFQDDYRISWIAVLRAARGEAEPCTSATYTVLGLHPDKVWPAIEARRRAKVGSLYGEFFGASLPPKKPVRSVRLAERKAMAAKAA